MIGNKYLYSGKEVTVTGTENNKIYFEGKNIGKGFVTENRFTTHFKDITEPKTIPKKTLHVATVKNTKKISAVELTKILQTGNTEEIKIARASSVENILQIPKNKSKNFYTVIGIIALIIIFFEAKLFKKLVK